LLRNPRVFLLDEPLSALDLSLRQKLQDEIIHLQERFKIPMIFVTHDWGEIFKLAHRIIRLENGKIIGQGSPEEVLGQHSLSGKFKFAGSIICIEKEDVVAIVTVKIGQNLTKVIVTHQEADTLKTGDNVIVSAKAFNPILLKV
jgi:molybdate transport system ATP-binding protein